jgi:hypothetical protein
MAAQAIVMGHYRGDGCALGLVYRLDYLVNLMPRDSEKKCLPNFFPYTVLAPPFAPGVSRLLLDYIPKSATD